MTLPSAYVLCGMLSLPSAQQMPTFLSPFLRTPISAAHSLGLQIGMLMHGSDWPLCMVEDAGHSEIL